MSKDQESPIPELDPHGGQLTVTIQGKDVVITDERREVSSLTTAYIGGGEELSPLPDQEISLGMLADCGGDGE